VLVLESDSALIAETPAIELESGAQPSVGFSVHDGSRLQWTATIPLDAREYDLEIELEIPSQVFTPHTPWTQLQAFARLDDPRAGAAGASAATIEELRQSAVAVALKLARASQGFARHAALAVRPTADAGPIAGAEGLARWLELARRTVRDARRRLIAPEAPDSEDVARERVLADDYLSTELISMLTGAGRALAELAQWPVSRAEPSASILADVEGALSEALGAEAAHRRSSGFAPCDSPSVGALERYQERASLLKKHFQQVLFLDPDVVQIGERAHNWIAAFVALLASSWAFAWQLALAGRANAPSTVGSGVLLLAVITGIIYAFKDRMKEVGRAWLTGRIHRFLGQRLSRYRLPPEIDPNRPVLVRARESFETETSARPDPLAPSARGAHVSVVRFTHKGKLGRGHSLARVAATQIRHSFRYDLSPLFPRMHDLAKPIAVADPVARKVQFLDAPRTYRVRLRARLRRAGETVEDVATLVMNKQGLQRLERDHLEEIQLRLSPRRRLEEAMLQASKRRGRPNVPAALLACAVAAGSASFVSGCENPTSSVVLDNGYPTSATNALVVYHGFWQAISFTKPVSPGSSSDPQITVPASANTAYVLVAPGWDPAADGGASTPASFIVLQSRSGFGLRLDSTLHIPVDDARFMGNCAAGSFLTQDQADFITQRVFASDFAGLSYDAATCTTTGGSR
jgi:hypothetical protein